MAKNTLLRRIQIIFDRLSAKKTEAEMAASLATAGKKGGENFLRELRKAFDKRMADLKVQLAKGLISPAQFKQLGETAAKQFNQGVVSGMESARKAGKLTDSEYLKLSRTLKRVGDDGATAGGRIGTAFFKASAMVAGFLAANFGIRQFARFLSESVHNALEAEDSISRLDSVLKPLRLSYREVASEVEKYLNRLQKTTRFSDEDAREALVNLVTGTGDYRKSLSLLDVTAKVAEKRHITMAEATDVVIKASKGLTRGMIDLGISTKETGDIVAKIDRNLGNLAEEGAQKGSGAIARLNNLWDEFKEKIGAAILGSDGLKKSLGPTGLIGTLTALNDWADQNSGALSSFIDKIFSLIKAGQEVGKFWLKFVPNPLMVSKLIDKLMGKKPGAAGEVEPGSSTTVKPTGVIRDDSGDDEPSKTAKARGAELVKIERDIAVARLQIAEGLTEALARDAVHRNELLHPQAERTTATAKELEEAWKRLDGLRNAVEVLATEGPDRLSQSLADVGVKAGSAIPAIQAMNEELFVQLKLLEAMAPAGSKLAEEIARVAREQWKAANAAEGLNSKWVDALQTIKETVVDSISGIGQAWVERGDSKERRQEIVKALKDENLSVERRIELEKELGDLNTPWLIKFAKAKVKENIAAALEMAAKALGFLVFGFGAQAGQAAASAAGHTAAAAAWRVVAGGGGNSGGASSTGGVGSSAPSSSRTSNMQAPGPEVHIHFKGPSVFNPEFQKTIAFAVQQAKETYGNNIAPTIHRDR